MCGGKIAGFAFAARLIFMQMFDNLQTRRHSRGRRGATSPYANAKRRDRVHLHPQQQPSAIRRSRVLKNRPGILESGFCFASDATMMRYSFSGVEFVRMEFILQRIFACTAVSAYETSNLSALINPIRSIV